MHTSARAKPELAALTAIISGLNESPRLKSGVTPFGGGADGIMSRAAPGGITEAMMDHVDVLWKASNNEG